jgi:hypothetical protein
VAVILLAQLSAILPRHAEGGNMRRYFNIANIAALSLLLFKISGLAAFGAAGTVGPQDAKAVVGLIKYLYAGYDNGANERKSFFDTVPWDIETGNLIERVDECERKEGDVIGFDWPSDSQDPQIRKLSVVYSGSPSPRHAAVRASFASYNAQIIIDYDMYLYDEAPSRWGVSNIRIHDDHGTKDLLETLRRVLKNECRGF